MSNKQFFNNLSATYADVRKLNAKKINLKGKNILEYIKESVPVILDERGTKADDTLDIWNSYVTKDENGNVIINRSAKPFVHGVKYYNGYIYEGITESQCNTLETAVKVIDGKVLGANDEHIMYWQTDGLTHAVSMFDFCENLTTFSSDLSSLTCGGEMFYCCNNLTTFNSDLPNLTEGDNMFNECENLTSFSSDLSSLTDGDDMFYSCTNLTSFSSNLSCLTTGVSMFDGCKLDAQSVANIIHFIPQRDAKPSGDKRDYGNITIGVGITNTEEAKQAFAEACYCDDWEELNKDFDDKNWGVEWQFNGEATTFDLRSPKPSTAVYAKLEEVTMPTNEKEHKPRYAYTSQDGSKFYNIHWYHDSNTNNEGYDFFESLEEAISAYSVIPK